MTYKEMFKVISKAWSSVDDIMIIASCGKTSATAIRNNIIKEIRKENKEIPYSKKIVVPTKRVIDYLDLDVEYIQNMALKEQELENAKLNYASISR